MEVHDGTRPARQCCMLHDERIALPRVPPAPTRYAVVLSPAERSALIAYLEHDRGPLAERLRAKLVAAKAPPRAYPPTWVVAQRAVIKARTWLAGLRLQRTATIPCKSCGQVGTALDNHGHCTPGCPVPEALRRG